MSRIQKGDRVRVTIVGDVDWTNGDAFEVGNTNLFSPQWDHVVSVEKLTPPKPKVGETITGQRLQGTMWKRGTIIAKADRPEVEYILTAEGWWYGFTSITPKSYPFSQFTKDYIVVRVA